MVEQANPPRPLVSSHSCEQASPRSPHTARSNSMGKFTCISTGKFTHLMISWRDAARRSPDSTRSRFVELFAAVSDGPAALHGRRSIDATRGLSRVGLLE